MSTSLYTVYAKADGSIIIKNAPLVYVIPAGTLPSIEALKRYYGITPGHKLFENMVSVPAGVDRFIFKSPLKDDSYVIIPNIPEKYDFMPSLPN